VDLWDYEEFERIRGELDLTRSEAIRKAVRMFTAVHNYRLVSSSFPSRKEIYNDEEEPASESIIMNAEERTEGPPYDETSENGGNRPRTYLEGSKPCSRCHWGRTEEDARAHCPYCIHFGPRADLFEDEEAWKDMEAQEYYEQHGEIPITEGYKALFKGAKE